MKAVCLLLVVLAVANAAMPSRPHEVAALKARFNEITTKIASTKVELFGFCFCSMLFCCS